VGLGELVGREPNIQFLERLIHGLELATYCLGRKNIDFQINIIMGQEK